MMTLSSNNFTIFCMYCDCYTDHDPNMVNMNKKMVFPNPSFSSLCHRHLRHWYESSDSPVRSTVFDFLLITRFNGFILLIGTGNSNMFYQQIYVQLFIGSNRLLSNEIQSFAIVDLMK